MKTRNLTLLLLVILLIWNIKIPASAALFSMRDWSGDYKIKISFGHIISEDNFVLWSAAGYHGFFLKNPYDYKRRSKIPSRIVNIAVLSSDVSKQKLALGFRDGDISLLEVSNVFNNKNWRNNIPILKSTDRTPVTALAFSLDKHTLASGTQSGAIVLWDTIQKKQFLELPKQNSSVITVAFSPDGMFLASGRENGSVRLLSLLDKQDLIPPIQHSGKVNMVGFSPDGDLMATASDDRSIRIWNIAEQKQLTQLSGHTGGVKVIAFSPDGKHLASGDEFGKVYLWKVSNGKKIDPIIEYNEYIKREELDDVNIKTVHRTEILAMVFSKNGVKLISECREKLITWDLSKVNINPDPSDLIYIPTPNPLIAYLQDKDNSPPTIEISEEVERRVTSDRDETTINGIVKDELTLVKSVTAFNKNIPNSSKTIYNSQIDENGKFTITSIPLIEGSNKIYVVAIDEKNNRNAEDKYEITIIRDPIPDDIPPAITYIDGFVQSGDTFQRSITQDDEKFVIKGTVVDKQSGVAKIEVVGEIDGEMASVNGNQFTATVTLKKGDNQIRVIATDHDDNEKEATLNIHRKMTDDLEAPKILINTPVNISNGVSISRPAGTKNITVTGTVSDNRSLPKDISVYINESKVAVDSASGKFSKPVKLNSGDTVITVQATDEAGNKSDSITFTAVIPKDISKPIPPIEPKTPTDIKIIFNAPSSFTMKGTGKQETVPHARRTEKLYCKIGGVVFGLENPMNYFYQVTIREKSTGEHRDPIARMLTEEGTFNFDDTSESLKLFNGLNEIEVIITSGSEKISRRFYIERIQGTEPHLDPPSPPVPPDDTIDLHKESLFQIETIRILDVELVKDEFISVPDYVKEIIENGEIKGIEINISSSNFIMDSSIKVLTQKFKGDIRLNGSTKGDGINRITFKTSEHENMKDVNYISNKFQIDKYKLEYQDNTLMFTAHPNDKSSKTVDTTIKIHRQHEREGKDYAILFAVEDYEMFREKTGLVWTNLDAPYNDAVEIANVLKNNYGFKILPGDKVMKNPTSTEILNTLELLAKDEQEYFGPDAQLLIFFAGHGYSIGEAGYFIPAMEENEPDYRSVQTNTKIRKTGLSHKDINDMIVSINEKCNNVLLVMDTCKSGLFHKTINRAITKTEYHINDDDLKTKIKNTTLQYLTSGSDDEDVIDAFQKDGHSPFAYQLLEALRDTSPNRPDNILTLNFIKNEYFDENIFKELLKKLNLWNDKKNMKVPQKPTSGEFLHQGHVEGGDFIFWRRK